MNPTRLLTLVVAAAVAVGAAGCLKYTRPVVAEPALPTQGERNFQALWLASQEVLREYRFTIDRMDRRAGLITTQPLTGQQFFEPWRKDAVNREALKDSSLKTLLRTAVVRIQPTGPGSDQYELTVEVTVAKPGTAPREVHSRGDAYDMFILPSEEEEDEENVATILGYEYQQPGAEEEPQAAEQPSYQDPKLAERIAEEILAAAARRVALGEFAR
jgi:hypothetical protein